MDEPVKFLIENKSSEIFIAYGVKYGILRVGNCWLCIITQNTPEISTLGCFFTLLR